jgi:eukaryotic-like serine/threonine-protein kinase
LNLKRNKKAFILVSILLAVIIASSIFLTGCVRGMSAIGWSGIAVADGTIYAGSKEGRLVSVDLNSNNARRFAEPIKSPASGGSSCFGGSACGGSVVAVAIYGTPALTEVPVLGKLIYIAGYNGKVYAYTADTLQQRWIYPIDGYLQNIISGVVISGDLLYFGCTDGYVYALDVSTGVEKWKFNTGDQIWSTPVIDNNLLIIGSFNKTIFAIDATSGTEKWRFTTDSTNIAPPVIINGTVYIGSLDRNFYALNAADGKERWRFAGQNWFWAKPVAKDGIIYAPCLDNKVYGLDEAGHNVVTYDVGGQVASWPVIANNQIIVATEDAKIWALDTTPANFNKSDNKKQIAVLPSGIEVTSPLAANKDMVYINASDNNIYIVNVTNQTISSPISLKSQ